MSIKTDDSVQKQIELRIKEYVTDNFNLNELTDDELYNAIEKTVTSQTHDTYMSISEQVEIAESIFSSIRGFGILDIIMKDDTITEVMINGHDHIYIEKNGVIKKLSNKFESRERLDDIIQRIVSMAGREVNQANPIVDTRLPDGSRVNIVLPPLSLCGPVVTIRKFSGKVISMEQLIKLGALTQEAADTLEILVKSKYNISCIPEKL